MGVSEKELCKYLDTPKFRGSVLQSAGVFMSTGTAMAGWWCLAVKFEPALSFLARAALTVVWALLVLRSYMIFHDCGHGSFFQGSRGARALNWITLHISSVWCGTPTDWNVGHQLHHANIGNVDNPDYDWGETVFHTGSQFLKLPAWKQRLVMATRHPVPFFLLAPLLTWWFKMRLPFELRPERKAAYRFSDKMFSAVQMAARYKLASHFGILDMVLAGDYLAMFIGVILFHWQHVYEHGYVRGSADWKIREASMHGSSMQTIPELFKPFTLGIEYHHIHHFRTRIPCYMLRTVHEQAPAGMWDEIALLSPADMSRSMSLQVYDDTIDQYATFSEVLARQQASQKAK